MSVRHRARRFASDDHHAPPRVKASAGAKLPPHFHWVKSGEDITQITALGPISLDYIHPGDDPRH